MTHPIANIMKSFFSHYLPVQRGSSTDTISSYRDATKLLLRYVADRMNKAVDALYIEDITESVVLSFLDHVEQERGCSAQTRNVRLQAIRSLFNYIGRQQPDLLVQCRQIHAIPLNFIHSLNGF